MDYEKKYKDAVERANIAYKDQDRHLKALLERVFPELVESEDERIRKELIEYIKSKYESPNAIKCDYEKWISWLKKQGERQQTYKVEPKFKVGDYVVGKYISGYISEIRDDCYLLDYQGFPIDKQDNYHLWTIDDAKDGDILISGQNIIIFKKFEEDSDCYLVIAYAGIDVSGKLQISNKYWFISNNATPAHKEQRDFLFQKMHEAGYEWDSEKKELKKVGQELTELAKGEDYGIDGLYAAVDILQKTLGKVDGYQTDDGILEHACAISAVKELYEQKHAWSERVQPQSKQEWKQENTDDLTGFENAMMHIGDSFFGQHAGLDPNNTNTIKEQANLLLELVPSKEWSEKDNRLLNDAISLADECDDFELRDWLKSLKAKYTWKPTDEQMKTLWDAICNLNHDGYKWVDDLKSLYQDLKKLKGE